LSADFRVGFGVAVVVTAVRREGREGVLVRALDDVPLLVLAAADGRARRGLMMILGPEDFIANVMKDLKVAFSLLF
jgi:hypothetical protein